MVGVLEPPSLDHLYRLTNANLAAMQNSKGRSRFSSPRPRAASIAPPVFRMNETENMSHEERLFLAAVERGDKPTIESLLANGMPNVNIKDVLGRTPIEIAVDNENIEIVEVLLAQPTIKIGNALLHAIREGAYKIVEMMIEHPSITSEMLGEGWGRTLDRDDALKSEYSSDISPVMLAAHLNQFEILSLLFQKGAKIPRPHIISCACEMCFEERELDSLHYSLMRIHSYRALASPAWIALTSTDPIFEAFKLSWELQRMSRNEWEFKEVYLELSEQCKTFACDLLSQCRSTEEVITILNKDPNSDPETSPVHFTGSKLTLARLKLAIKYEQKRFVAHPHCQQLLASIWYEGFPTYWERDKFKNYVICALLMLLWPLLAMTYILFPKSRVGQIVRSPFMKFLYFSTSFGAFLILLTMASFEDYRMKKGEALRSSNRAPFPTLVEWFIVVWVLGMCWAEVKQLWDEGFTRYILQWWNWLDFVMMTLYLSTFTLRGVALYLKSIGDPRMDPPSLPRSEWVAYEPVLVSEGLFAIANVFSFARIIYLFQTNPYLGPLQISLGCMLIDIAKFFFIFSLILTSFAVGLHQLYWYYDARVDPGCVGPGCHANPESFTSLVSSYTSLIWSLFSITNTRDTEVLEPHDFTEWVGRGLLIAYHVTSIIVLLNMLIAMMSHSFQIINDHADLEWKFHRTKLWMTYFDEGSSLPAPFNIIPTPKSFCYLIRYLIDLVRFCCGKNNYWRHRSKRATIRRPGYNKDRWLSQKRRAPSPDEMPPPAATDEKTTYKDIMFRLVSRYIHMTKKEMRMDGVNEDDLLEIKQDISSLRFELREDRRKDIQRSSTHIDGVKKEIIRTLSMVSSPVAPRPQIQITSPSREKSSGSPWGSEKPCGTHDSQYFSVPASPGWEPPSGSGNFFGPSLTPIPSSASLPPIPDDQMAPDASANNFDPHQPRLFRSSTYHRARSPHKCVCATNVEKMKFDLLDAVKSELKAALGAGSGASGGGADPGSALKKKAVRISPTPPDSIPLIDENGQDPVGPVGRNGQDPVGPVGRNGQDPVGPVGFGPNGKTFTDL